MPEKYQTSKTDWGKNTPIGIEALNRIEGNIAWLKDRLQIFTASGTYIATSSEVYLIMCGAGGGGAGGASTRTGGKGGSGQVLFMKKVTVTFGESIAITVGTKGLGGAGVEINYSGAGTSGGASSFGSYASAVGGGGGGAAFGENARGYNGATGTSYSVEGIFNTYGAGGAGGAGGSYYGSNGNNGSNGIVIVIAA
jgi:hypothetical protein